MSTLNKLILYVLCTGLLTTYGLSIIISFYGLSLIIYLQGRSFFDPHLGEYSSHWHTLQALLLTLVNSVPRFWRPSLHRCLLEPKQTLVIQLLD